MNWKTTSWTEAPMADRGAISRTLMVIPHSFLQPNRPVCQLGREGPLSVFRRNCQGYVRLWINLNFEPKKTIPFRSLSPNPDGAPGLLAHVRSLLAPRWNKIHGHNNGVRKNAIQGVHLKNLNYPITIPLFLLLENISVHF